MDISDKVRTRLKQEQVLWLTTVTPTGQPQSSLVWFLWDGTSFVIYSQPGGKTKAISSNPNVSLNLNSDAQGGSVATFEGVAEIVADAAPATSSAEYIDKYRQGISHIGLTPETFAAKYSVTIRVTPKKLRAW